MTKEKKVALALTGVMLFGATTTSLTGCKTKEKQETGISVSETSIDTKDIVVIDTYNPNVLSNGMEGRYVIMYKIWTESIKFDKFPYQLLSLVLSTNIVELNSPKFSGPYANIASPSSYSVNIPMHLLFFTSL